MSGRDDALRRCFAHEQRRHGRRVPLTAAERTEIRGRELEVVRWMNQVDRAVAGYRRTQDEELAA